MRGGGFALGKGFVGLDECRLRGQGIRTARRGIGERGLRLGRLGLGLGPCVGSGFVGSGFVSGQGLGLGQVALVGAEVFLGQGHGGLGLGARLGRGGAGQIGERGLGAAEGRLGVVDQARLQGLGLGHCTFGAGFGGSVVGQGIAVGLGAAELGGGGAECCLGGGFGGGGFGAVVSGQAGEGFLRLGNAGLGSVGLVLRLLPALRQHLLGAGLVGGGELDFVGAGLRGFEGGLGGGFVGRGGGAGQGFFGGLDLGDALGQGVGSDFLRSGFVSQGRRRFVGGGLGLVQSGQGSGFVGVAGAGAELVQGRLGAGLGLHHFGHVLGVDLVGSGLLRGGGFALGHGFVGLGECGLRGQGIRTARRGRRERGLRLGRLGLGLRPSISCGFVGSGFVSGQGLGLGQVALAGAEVFLGQGHGGLGLGTRLG